MPNEVPTVERSRMSILPSPFRSATGLKPGSPDDLPNDDATMTRSTILTVQSPFTSPDGRTRMVPGTVPVLPAWFGMVSPGSITLADITYLPVLTERTVHLTITCVV